MKKYADDRNDRGDAKVSHNAPLWYQNMASCAIHLRPSPFAHYYNTDDYIETEQGKNCLSCGDRLSAAEEDTDDPFVSDDYIETRLYGGRFFKHQPGANQ